MSIRYVIIGAFHCQQWDGIHVPPDNLDWALSIERALFEVMEGGNFWNGDQIDFIVEFVDGEATRAWGQIFGVWSSAIDLSEDAESVRPQAEKILARAGHRPGAPADLPPRSNSMPASKRRRIASKTGAVVDGLEFPSDYRQSC